MNTAGGKVSFSMESTRETPWTPTVPIAVDTRTKNILDVHAVDDDDESWSSEDKHKSGWNTRFKGGTYRGMLYGVVLQNYSRQVVLLVRAGDVPVNFSLGHKNTTKLMRRLPFYSAKQTNRHLLFRVKVDAKKLSYKGSEEHSVRKMRDTVRKGRRTPRLDPNSFSRRHTGKTNYTRERYIASIIELTLT